MRKGKEEVEKMGTPDVLIFSKKVSHPRWYASVNGGR
jgi:hypothetical protein